MKNSNTVKPSAHFANPATHKNENLGSLLLVFFGLMGLFALKQQPPRSITPEMLLDDNRHATTQLWTPAQKSVSGQITVSTK